MREVIDWMGTGNFLVMAVFEAQPFSAIRHSLYIEIPF